MRASNNSLHVHTLDEFLSMTREKLDTFERFWREQVATGNDNFPVYLPLGDWDEQFDIFEPEEGM